MRRLLACLLLLALCAAPAAAQVVHDASASGTYVSGTSFTWNHTFASGSKGLIFVGYKFSAFESITGVTVGGSAATFVSRASNAGGGNRIELWKHESPSSGSQAIVVTFDGNLAADSGSGGGISISATGSSGFAAGTTSGPTTTMTPSVTIGSLGATDMPYAGNLDAADPTEGDTLLVELSLAAGNFLSVTRQAVGGDGVMNWSTASLDESVMVGTRAIASGGGGGGCTGARMTLTGAGC